MPLATQASISRGTRAATIKRRLSPLQLAVLKLRENEPNGTGSATPEQILAVAEEFELWGGPSELEGVYLDACDRAAEE